MVYVKICCCVRTQLSLTASQNLELSNFFVTFAPTKGSRIKVNSKLKDKSKLKYNNINNIINNNINNNMEIIYNTIQTTLNSFDFAYCITINILTYLIITIINSRNGNIDMKMWSKRIVLLISVVVVGAFYYFTGSNIKLLINSSILAPVFWSWVMKPICRHFKIDYKQLNLFE